jgi:hypothetical protein
MESGLRWVVKRKLVLQAPKKYTARQRSKQESPIATGPSVWSPEVHKFTAILMLESAPFLKGAK